jgi:hypothetical protein
LFDPGLEPGFELCWGFAKKRPAHGGQMLHGMEKVWALAARPSPRRKAGFSGSSRQLSCLRLNRLAKNRDAHGGLSGAI